MGLQPAPAGGGLLEAGRTLVFEAVHNCSGYRLPADGLAGYLVPASMHLDL